MIARLWFGTTPIHNAEAYIEHLEKTVFPELEDIEGHRGAYILKMIEEEVIKFAIITLWDSMDAVCQFAGDAPEIAVIPDEAKRLLSTFDRGVKHFEVIHAPDEIN